MDKELERRSYMCNVELAPSGSGSHIEGRPIVYDSATNIGGFFNEVIERGALDGCDLTDVRFLVNHDINKIPLARSRRNNGNSTMQLIHDEFGLKIDVDLDTENNAEAKSLFSAVQRGDVSGMSFMFAVADEEWDGLESEMPTRRIKKLSTVVEVSAVTFPAYEDTEISTRDKRALENARQALDNARRSCDIQSVDTDELELLKLKTKILGGI
jgi:HK97 family phage prohead protease